MSKLYSYCFQCPGIPDGVLLTAKPMCGDCRREGRPMSLIVRVSCLVCLDQGEVSALGEEILCPRKCGAAKRIRESYDKLNLNFEQYLERTLKERADEQKS